MERNFTLIVLFAALIAVLGLVPPLMLPTGVPVSAQSLGVMLAGAVLGSKRGALAVIVIVAVVALGLPVLSGGRGGLGVFAGPTVGFLLGWIPAAFVTGLVVEKMRNAPVGVAAGAGAVLGGIVVLYLCGTFGMMAVLHKGFGAALGLSLPFIPGDLIKAVVAGWLVTVIARYRPSALLSRAE
ncbi:biotin transporter BioY [Paenirhodobacter enshiensis]|uniref:Biotin transporter n=1 Tax=Paenirhodobacter enshiensis TaxID=1105367 RepID=A0A086Y466_9RHOB|nr:biotin transporter BioY [Paenirhodobacter enshiensis]KFI29066.1 biotin biosynthesis protein BioC [Paenirhodobacter enshiensis]